MTAERIKVRMLMRLQVQSPGLNRSPRRKMMKSMRKVWWLEGKGTKIKEFRRDMELSLFSIMLSWALIKCRHLMRDLQVGIHFTKDLSIPHTSHTRHRSTLHNTLKYFTLLRLSNNFTRGLRCTTNRSQGRAYHSLGQCNLIRRLSCQVLQVLWHLNTVKSGKDRMKGKGERRKSGWKAAESHRFRWKTNEWLGFLLYEDLIECLVHKLID